MGERNPAARTVQVGGMSSLPGSGKRCAVQFQISGTMAKQMKRATAATEQSREGDCFKYATTVMADESLKMEEVRTKQQNSGGCRLDGRCPQERRPQARSNYQEIG